jgi:hypothetical protein
MLKRQRRAMRLVRIGLAISVCLSVVLFKWRLLAAFVELPVEGDFSLPPVTGFTIATGAFEFIAATLLATASMNGESKIFFLATRLLKYYFLMQLLVSVLALMADGIANPLAISDMCRFLVLISLLAFLDVERDVRLTRDRARAARRGIAKSRLQKVAYKLEHRELNQITRNV